MASPVDPQSAQSSIEPAKLPAVAIRAVTEPPSDSEWRRRIIAHFLTELLADDEAMDRAIVEFKDSVVAPTAYEMSRMRAALTAATQEPSR